MEDKVEKLDTKREKGKDLKMVRKNIVNKEIRWTKNQHAEKKKYLWKKEPDVWNRDFEIKLFWDEEKPMHIE